jgi:hypothetical protein
MESLVQAQELMGGKTPIEGEGVKWTEKASRSLRQRRRVLRLPIQQL